MLLSRLRQHFDRLSVTLLRLTTIQCYDRAIVLNPQFTRAFYNRGNAKLEQNDTSDACADWLAAKALGHPSAAAMIQQYCGK